MHIVLLLIWFASVLTGQISPIDDLINQTLTVLNTQMSICITVPKWTYPPTFEQFDLNFINISWANSLFYGNCVTYFDITYYREFETKENQTYDRFLPKNNWGIISVHPEWEYTVKLVAVIISGNGPYDIRRFNAPAIIVSSKYDKYNKNLKKALGKYYIVADKLEKFGNELFIEKDNLTKQWEELIDSRRAVNFSLREIQLREKHIIKHEDNSYNLFVGWMAIFIFSSMVTGIIAMYCCLTNITKYCDRKNQEKKRKQYKLRIRQRQRNGTEMRPIPPDDYSDTPTLTPMPDSPNAGSISPDATGGARPKTTTKPIIKASISSPIQQFGGPIGAVSSMSSPLSRPSSMVGLSSIIEKAKIEKQITDIQTTLSGFSRATLSDIKKEAEETIMPLMEIEKENKYMTMKKSKIPDPPPPPKK